MRTAQQFWEEEGCRQSNFSYAEEWCQFGYLAGIKESRLANPPINCEAQDGENFAVETKQLEEKK